MSFMNDIKIKVVVRDGQPTVTIMGGPITHGELRVILKMIEDEYVKFIREKRNDGRAEQQKSE